MHTLLLCTDGVLRVRHHVHDRARKRGHHVEIPVPHPAEDNGARFLSLLQSEVVFDPGLTGLQLFRCLEPWSEIMSGIALLDFAAFPREAAAPRPAGEDNDLLRIEIACTAEITAEASDPPAPSPESLFERIPGTRTYTLNWGSMTQRGGAHVLRLEYGWSSHGIVRPDSREDGITRVGVLGTPVNLWADIPVVIQPDMDIWDHTAEAREFGKLAHFLNPASPEVWEAREGLLRLHPGRLLAPKPNFFDAVVRGLFWEVGFFGAPDRREEKVAEIAEAGADFDEPGPDISESLEAREARIRAEIAAEEAAERERELREPFSDRDQAILASAAEAERLRPGLVRYPSGRPGTSGRAE
jgi:hypothetical protein